MSSQKMILKAKLGELTDKQGGETHKLGKPMLEAWKHPSQGKDVGQSHRRDQKYITGKPEKCWSKKPGVGEVRASMTDVQFHKCLVHAHCTGGPS